MKPPLDSPAPDRSVPELGGAGSRPPTVAVGRASASEAEFIAAAEAIAAGWAGLGTRGSFLAVNPVTGAQLGFGLDEPVPLASVAKVPVALAALQRIDLGLLDPAAAVLLGPDDRSVGVTGTALFRYGASIAVADLISLALTVSDNAAADAVIDMIGLDAVSATVESWGIDGIHIRHPMRVMFDSATRAAAGSFELALELAVAGPPGDRVIEALDPERANIASARGLVRLLTAVWQDEISTPSACAELRRLMGLNVFAQRLAAELRCDAVQVSSKTGTFLNLRHDVGVVEAGPGQRVVIAALTRTSRRASLLPDVDLAIGAAARTAFDLLRH